MYRATTPTFTFKIPYDVSTVDNFIISFAQNGTVLLEKNKSQCVCSGKTVTVSLSVAETKLFNYKAQGQLQMRIKLNNGGIFASDVKTFDVHRVFNEGVL